MDKFLSNANEMRQVVKEAPFETKHNYGLFRLDPREQIIVHNKRQSKQRLYNDEDPFYKKKIYNNINSGVYKTEKLLNVIKPKDHFDVRRASKDEIRQQS